MPKYTLDQILRKKFSAALNGYDPEEVDAFIDELMQDIREYQLKIQKLQNK